MSWLDLKLDQAGLAFRPAEALVSYGFVLGLSLIGAALLGGWLAVIGVGALGLVPPAALSARAGRRLRRFTEQLPDMLTLTAGGLKAGYSFLQGLETVAQEVRDPMSSEVRRVVVEAQLGRPVEAALQECAARMQSVDFDWAVRAVGIQREVGGNLAELLETVAETMVERERLRREVRALTAEGRVSAVVLTVLPLLVGVGLFVLNRPYVQVLFDHTGGRVAMAAAVVGVTVGFFWMNKIIDIKV
jgi:tight adherence protein B